MDATVTACRVSSRRSSAACSHAEPWAGEKRAGDATPTSAEQLAVAGSVINAIPIVCAAPPGVMARPLATPFREELAREG